MTLKQFTKSLKKGTGEAIIYLKQRDKKKLSKKFLSAILHASFYNLGYDQQIEMNRAEYMYRVINLSGGNDYCLKKIRESLLKDKLIEDWNKYHRFKILMLSLKQSKGNLNLINDLIKYNVKSTYSGIISEDVLNLIGYDGFLFLIYIRGEALINDKNYYENDDLLKEANKKFGYYKVRSKLLRLSITDLKVKKYLEAVKRHKLKIKNRKNVKKKLLRKSIARPPFERDNFNRRIKRLKNPFKIATELEGLIENYKAKDYKLIESILQRRYNDEEFHAIAWTVDDIYKKNLTKNCKKSMLLIYERINCQHHRYSAIKTLIRNGIILKWLMKEAVYDCNPEIRSTARYYLKKLTRN